MVHLSEKTGGVHKPLLFTPPSLDAGELLPDMFGARCAHQIAGYTEIFNEDFKWRQFRS